MPLAPRQQKTASNWKRLKVHFGLMHDPSEQV
jgi:hypothetical protein